MWFGAVGSEQSISQAIVTTPGYDYQLTYYLASNGTTPNQFTTTVNGTVYYNQTNIATQPWTQYNDTFDATSSSTLLTFAGRDDPSALALDNVSLTLVGLGTGYWLGNASSVWTGTNWATDSSGTTTNLNPSSVTDVTFSASGAVNQTTTLGADTTIKSLTINDPTAVTIGGANTLTVSGSTGTTGITINNGAGLLTISSNLALGGSSQTITVNNAAGAVISGNISGSTGLIKAGAGTLSLGGSNSYSGSYTSINAGTLIATNNNAFSNTTVYVGNGYTPGTAATLLLGGNSGGVNVSNIVSVNPGDGTNRTVGGTNTSGTDTFSGLVQMDGFVGENRSMNVTAAAGGTVAFTNTISGSGQGVTMIGAGTVIFAGNNTYTGATTISAGTLAIGAGGSIADSSGVNLAASGATFDISNSGNQTIQNLSGVAGSVVNLGTNTLTEDNTVSTEYDGSIQGNSATYGINLIKTGTATLTLGGASTYTGGTIIDFGMLAVSGTAASITGNSSSITYVGYNTGDNASLLISNGGQVNDADAEIGGTLVSNGLTTTDTVASGTVTVTGVGSNGVASTLNNLNFLSVGAVGGVGSVGVLNIEDGAKVSDSQGSVGGNGNLGFETSSGYTGYIMFAASTGTATVSGVNANGSISTWNNSYLLSISGSASGAALNVEDGGLVTDEVGQIGEAGNSTVTVTGVNENGTASTWLNSQTLYVGMYESNAVLNVENGGVVSAPSVILADQENYLVNGAAPQNTVNLDSGGILETGSIIQGSATYGGTINIDGGILRATASSTSFVSGFSSGEISLQSGGGTIDNNGYNITIAAPIGGTGVLTAVGSGTTTLTAANTYSGGTTIDFGTLAVSGAGASISHSGASLYTGYNNGDNGTLLISNGGQVTDSYGYIGLISGSTGNATVTGIGSSWSNVASLTVGYYSGTAMLTVSNGSTVSDSYGYIGTNAGSTGNATVTGTGSSWANSSDLYVGYQGTGTLNIQDGGQVTNTDGYIGYNAGSSGTATVTGIYGSTASTWSGNNLSVGYEGTGTLNIQDGGQVTSPNAVVGEVAGSTGIATVTGVNANGTASTWNDSNYLPVGYRGTGTLNVEDGGQVIDSQASLGAYNGSNGSATVTGVNANGTASAWNTSGEFVIGSDGAGSLNVQSGGKVSDSFAYIGEDSDATGTVTVAGATGNTNSMWSNSGELLVGYYGPGTLTIQNGGQVTDNHGSIGDQAGSVGTVTVSGVNANGTASTWATAAELYVGNNGTGTLNVQNGGQVSDTNAYIGTQPGSNGTATVTGMSGSTASAWNSTGFLAVGYLGSGTLNIEEGGVVSSPTVILADINNAGGTLNLDSNGVLETGSLLNDFGAGGAAVNFNGGILLATANNSNFIANFSPGEVTLQNGGGTIDNGDYAITVAAPIGGTGVLTSTGAGTLTLTGNNTYSGGTIIENGVLEVSSENNLGGSSAGGIALNGGELLTSTTTSIAEGVTIGNPSSLAAVTNTTATYTGVIANGGNPRPGPVGTVASLLIGDSTGNDNGTVIFTGNNTYLRATTINSGTLAIGAGGGIADSSGVNLAASGTTFDISNGGSQTIQDLSGVSGSKVKLGGNTLTEGTANSTEFDGIIQGIGGSLVKQGAGTLTLTGNNTYNGGTTVSAGTLAVNGSVAGNVFVSSGGTIGGGGTVGGKVTVASGGSTYPGDPQILTAGSAEYKNGSTAQFAIATNNSSTHPPTPGVDYDQIKLTANTPSALQIDPGTTTLQLNLSAASVAALQSNASNNINDLYFVFNLGSGTSSGQFSDLTLTEGANTYTDAITNGMATFAQLDLQFNLSYTGSELNNSLTGGNDVAFDVQTVPEPSTWALLLGGLGLLAFWRTRRASR